MTTRTATDTAVSSLSVEDVIDDYRLAFKSRQASLIGRKEVLTGKAKFGVFGDGKEVPQLAMARAFRPGDLRSGYYRDQTFMLAAGLTTLEQLFAQLYADPAHDPASSGRQMNAHFATHTLDDHGAWRRLVDLKNSTADTSPTGSQMPRLVGLAYASRLYRELDELRHLDSFSRGGDEIAFGTIGNASCAEGMFWEAINAAGLLRAPVLMSIWDDDYGISVHNEHQIVKEDLSAVLAGFGRDPDSDDKDGYDLYRVKGWDYPTLCDTYVEAARTVRRDHVPAIIHVIEVTQPQGHSTSGSHERYKSEARLAWEREHDCLTKMREWMVSEGLASETELADFERADKEEVRAAQKRAWKAFMDPIRHQQSTLLGLIDAVAGQSPQREAIERTATTLGRVPSPVRRNLATAAWEVLFTTRGEDQPSRQALLDWYREFERRGKERYGSHLYSESARRAPDVAEIAPIYADDAADLRGFEILNRCFDAAFDRTPELIAFGEDVGQLGDVNQGLSGLQEKYGKLRVSDTGIRECTILGQAIGMAMRGLRPLAEIQYLDYLHYALQILSDDLATVRYRTRGRQMAPVIIRTRGHRLEGIWHSGSPMSGILGLVRGVYVCVPRDMTRAAGFYNTLLQSDDSALVIEVLNGYRKKEKLPSNIDQMTVPLGVPEILREGSDVTIVTYGACCSVALDAAERLASTGIDVEVIDVQTLLPFDRPGVILGSLKRTHRIVFLDEDVPGGASAYMMQQVLEKQRGYHWLDAEPRTLTGTEHRPAYGSDGDYWSKPQPEHVFTAVYELMHEASPARFPIFYR